MKSETELVSTVKEKIKATLTRNITIDTSEMCVEVQNGRVTLYGPVSSWTEKEDAEKAAWSVPGVTQVDNQLFIRLMWN